MQRRAFALACASVLLARSGTAAPLRVGAAPGVQSQVLQIARQAAERRGLGIEVVEHGTGLAEALAAGTLHAACFPDGVAFDADPLRRGGRLLAATTTVTLPYGLYSRRLTTPRQLGFGDTVAIPQEPAAASRALVLLHNHGVIVLRDGTGLRSTLADVVSNRLRLDLQPLPQAALFDALRRVVLAVLGPEQAARAGLEPARDAIGLEDARSPYAGVLGVRRDDERAAWLVPLVQAYHSDEVKRFLLDRFRGSVRRPW